MWPRQFLRVLLPFLLALSAGYALPVSGTATVVAQSDTVTFSDWQFPESLNDSFQTGVSTINHHARRAAYARAAHRLSQQAYWIPLYRVPTIVTVNRRVQGIAGSLLNPDGYATERWRVL